MNQLSFFNTVNLTGEPLQGAEKIAKSLEEKVLEQLKRAPHGLTKADLCLMYGQQWADISYGRSLTNLSNDPESRVVKTSEMRKGLRGISNHVYKYSKPLNPQK